MPSSAASAGLFDLKAAGFSDPLLVAANDGVGTKLKLAIELGRHDGVGIDLVAMCANDLIVQGAEPLFFLDYYATGKLDNEVADSGRRLDRRGLPPGGLRADRRRNRRNAGHVPAGDYDLAGFCVGAVERDKLLTGANISPGDIILGLASSGVHSNGFSLVRRIVEERGWKLGRDTSRRLAGRTLGEVLLEPTRIYVRSLLPLVQQGRIKGLAHITGGGLLENIPRVLPDSCHAIVDTDCWDLPPIFAELQAGGQVAAGGNGADFQLRHRNGRDRRRGRGGRASLQALEWRRRNGHPDRPHRSRPARLHGARRCRPLERASGLVRHPPCVTRSASQS